MLSFFFLRSDGVCWTGDQLALLYSVHLLFIHFILSLSHISPSFSLDSLLYHLFLRQSSITVHVQRYTHLPFMILFLHSFIVRKASPEGYLFQGSVVARKSQVEVCERRGKSFIKYFKEPKNASKKHALWQYHLHVKVTRKWPEDLLSYRFILTKQIYEKGATF